MRFNSDGTLDTTFDSDGKVKTDFGGQSITGVAIQNDGKIVIAGGTDNFLVERYDRDGSLDTSFGTNGRQTTNFPGLYDQPSGLAIQSDGKIAVVGWTGERTGYSEVDLAIARYDVDGSLDSTFGVGGMVTTDFGTFGDEASGVAIDTSGRIVVVGSTNLFTASSVSHFAVARYTSEGALDATFATGGKRGEAFDAASEDFANDVAIRDDGLIIVAGSTGALSGTSVLARIEQASRLLYGLNPSPVI